MTKRKIVQGVIIALLLFEPKCVLSQSFDWVKQIGTAGLNYGYSLKVDKVGNVYVTVSFEGTALFDSVSVVSKGGQDIFIAKYSNSGDLIWVKSAGGTLYDEAFSLRLDSKEENIIITGFMQNGQFGDTTLSGYPYFVAKYDTSGKLVWAKAINAAGGGSATSVAVDSSDNIFVTGGPNGFAEFDTVMLASPYFIVKYDKSDSIAWIRGVTRTYSSGSVQPSDIDCDLSNNIYVTGFIETDTIRFDSTHVLIPQANGNMFLIKYDSLGKVDWAIKSDNIDFAGSSGISFDAQNNIYLTGNFIDSISFGGINLQGNNAGNIFLVKYDSNGTPLWAVKGEGKGYCNGSAVTLDKDGNIYVTGVASDATWFGNTELGHGGIFITKYDPNGKCIFATSAGSIPADIQSWGRDIAVIDTGNIFLTGYMGGNVHFGQTTLSNNVGQSIFITKLSTENSTGVKRVSYNPATFNLSQNYPNPFNPETTIEYYLPSAGYVSLIVYDILGNKVAHLIDEHQQAGSHSVRFDGTRLASGVYFYRIQAGNYIATKKLVLIK